MTTQIQSASQGSSSIRKSVVTLSYLFQIRLPFHRQQVFFLSIAFFATGYQVSLGAFSPSGQGNDMVHGQRPCRKRLSAVMALPFCEFSFPPLGIPEFPGFPAFRCKPCLIEIDFRRIRHVSSAIFTQNLQPPVDRLYQIQTAMKKPGHSNPNRFNAFVSFLQFFWTRTKSSRKTRHSKKASISFLASVPICESFCPAFPIRIPFWESRST